MASLDKILDDLSMYKRDKSILLKYYIEKRLQDSLRTYYKELNNSVNYLEARHETKMSKEVQRDECI